MARRLGALALTLIFVTGCSGHDAAGTWISSPVSVGNGGAVMLRVPLPSGVHPTGLTTDGKRVLFGYATPHDSGSAPSGTGTVDLTAGTASESVSDGEWKPLQLVAVAGATFTVLVRDQPPSACADPGFGCVDWRITRDSGRGAVILDASPAPTPARDTPTIMDAGGQLCWPRSVDGHAGGPTDIVVSGVSGSPRVALRTRGWIRQCLEVGSSVLLNRRIFTTVQGQPAGISDGLWWTPTTSLRLVWPGADKSAIYGQSFAWVSPVDPLASTREVHYGTLPNLMRSVLLPVGGDIYGVGWVDDSHLAVYAEDGLSVVDVVTDEITTIATQIAPGSGLAAGHGVLAYADIDGSTLDVIRFSSA